jgi:hypothetical protein
MTTVWPPHQDSGFGFDPWIGPAPPPSPAVSEDELLALLRTHQVITGATIYAGADTLGGDIYLLPPGLSMYASYVDGYGGYSELVARFSHTDAMLVSITIGGNSAHCADFEPGAMQISEFPHWYDHIANHEYGLPWGYTSASNMQTLIDAAGGRPFIRWSGHYGWGPHICSPRTCGYPQSHWTQWDQHGAQGQNIDRSVGTWFYSPTPPPKPKPPEDAVAISATQNRDGRLEIFVEKSDGEIIHTWQASAGGTWVGAKPGVRAQWFSLGNVNTVGAATADAPTDAPAAPFDQEAQPLPDPAPDPTDLSDPTGGA